MVTYSSDAGAIDGDALHIQPRYTGGSVAWDCTRTIAGTTVEDKYLPSACRP
ncbi:MAG: pilin [Rhodanobacter sp.]